VVKIIVPYHMLYYNYMKYTTLTGWSKLTPEEKKRFKEIHGDRFKDEYNTRGELSISKKELKKGGDHE